MGALQRHNVTELAELIGCARPRELPQLLEIIQAQPVAIDAETGDAARYNAHRNRMAAREKSKSAAGREIGPIPPPLNIARRRKTVKNLKLFLETYLPRWFPKKWSKDHLRIIRKIQQAVLIGGFQAIAMPRGSGKTTICNGAALWAALNGHHQFLMVLHANEKKAEACLDILKLEIEINPLLAEDFPEVCFPVHCLERIANRAKGQTSLGVPTYLEWAGDKLVLPTTPGSASAGVVILVGGLQEAIRGALHAHPETGRLIRPSFALIDDPQTTATARSEVECDTREKLIRADLLGTAGPGEPFSALMPCTVIEPNDVATRFLDRERNPEWRGERCKMLVKFPSGMELWEEYDAVRRRCLKDAEDDETDEAINNEELYRECNEFYAAHRAAMDAGAEVSWEERKYPWELSAIQHALNLFLRDPVTFYSEFQNDPQAALETDEDLLTAREIAHKLSGLERFRIPEGCQYVTGFVDVHKRILYYALTAWTPSFDGYVIDYGTYPKQRHPYFTERTARPTLADLFPKRGLEGTMYAGIEACCNHLFKLKLKRDDGARMPINLVMIDSAYKPDVVFRYCAASPYEARVAPSLGRKIGPDQLQLSRCKPRKGEHIGLEWTIPAASGRQVRQVQYDTWFWKTFLHRRLSTALGDRGSLSLFGQLQHGRPDVDHDFFADHLLAQYSTPLTGKRTVDVWKLKPGQSQDHWLDVLTGCTAGASVMGSQVVGAIPRPGKRQPKRQVQYAA